MGAVEIIQPRSNPLVTRITGGGLSAVEPPHHAGADSCLDDLALTLRLLDGVEAAVLEAALPRLRLCASLWDALHHAPCVEAVAPHLADGAPIDWALASLGVVVGVEDGDAWLTGDGAPLLTWAWDGFPPDFLPAALRELARRWPLVRPLALAVATTQAGAPWSETIAACESALTAHPEAVMFAAGRAALPPLIAALLDKGHAGLAARAVAANIPAAAAAEHLHELRLPSPQQVSLSRALAALGFAGHAAAVAHGEPLPLMSACPPDHVGGAACTLAERVNIALLAAERGQRAEARRALTAARTDAHALAGALSAALADLLRGFDAAAAETAVREAVNGGSTDAAFTLQLAAVQMDAGRPDDVLRTLASCAGGRDPVAHLLAARAHLALGDARAGADDAHRALAAPLDGEQALEASRLFARADDLKEATAAAKRATALTPWNPAAWINLAEIHRAGGELEAASAAYGQAVTLAPNAPAARTALAECLGASGRLDEAARQFEAAAALAPDDARVAAGLARLALLGNAPDRAAEIAREGLAHDPENGALHDILGGALEALGARADAASHYEQATRLAPTLAHPWLRLAAHQREARQHAKARATLEAAADVVPMTANNVSVLLALADVYLAAGEHKLARDALAHALAVTPSDNALLTRYGAALRALGQTREALAVLQAAADSTDGACRGEAAHEMALAYDMLGESVSALSAAQIAVASQPDSPAYQATLGRVALKAGRADIAADALNVALAATDTDPELYSLLGRAYRVLGDPKQAMDAHRLALRMQPDSLDYQYDFALAARDDGQHEPAIIALRDVVAAQPDHAAAHLALGLSLEVVRCWQDAYQALTAAASGLPTDPEPHQALGRVCMHLRQPQYAIDALNTALALDPDDVASYRLLGEAYSMLGRVDDAVSAFHQALEHSPDDPGLHAAIGAALLDLDAHAKAIPVLKRARTLAPKDAQVCSALSRAYRGLNQADAALEAARAAVEIAPDNAAYHVALGELLSDTDGPNAAVEWTIALQLNPDDEDTRWRLIELSERMGRPGMALEVAEPLIEDEYADKSLLERTARWALAAGDVSRAVHLVGLAVTLDGRDPALHALAGAVALANGEPMRALAALRYAAELDPRTSAYRVRIAELLLGQNRPGEALDEAQQALALGVDDTDDLLALGQLFNKVQRWSMALPLLKRVIERRREDPVPWLEMGQARIVLAARAAQLADAGVTRERLSKRELQATLRVVEQAIALGATGPSVTLLHGQALSLLGEHSQALTLLEEAYHAAPSSHTRLALGEGHLRAGDLDAAAPYLAPASDQPQLEPARLVALGALHLARDDAQAALIALKQAATAAPGNPIAHYRLAQVAAALERRATAVEALTQAINLVPDVPDWHYQLGALLLDMGHAPEAITQLEQAVALQPENADYLVKLGCALRAADDAEAAIARYEEALHLAPEAHADWWRELGDLYETLDTDSGVQRASQCYRRALKIDEAHAPALLGLARLALADGQIGEAQTCAARAVQAAPENADAQAALAACIAHAGDVEQAALLYERAAALAAERAPILLALGQLYSDAGQWPKAIDALHRSLDAAPPDAPPQDTTYAALAGAYAHLDQLEAAIEAAQNAAEAAPGQAAHWRRLGHLFRLAGQHDHALDALQQAVTAEPDSPDAHHEIGLVYEAREQFTQALEAYQTAMRAAPDQAESFFRAGLLLKRMKDYHNAIQMFQQARRLDPDNAEAHRQFATVSALGFVSSAPVGVE